ncbi:Sgd1 protein [Candida orthopsilosis Co 90-125]|uniref:Sgd1 protein n=1 Tax=Candida orthopsilosis (strain 90-125) TaxID=1136231 RepID=H8WVW4_CANO9|nr:Sgd1 protein [Candida orthopsilosis Co 90-125]CCG20588.1 Sgd1 protein [Candida orthopsilosis Co 90-125]
MARPRNGDVSRTIQLPSQILEQINDKQARGEYDSGDARYGTPDSTGSKKRKSNKVLSRKEKRKQERTLKKQKQRPNVNATTPISKTSKVKEQKGKPFKTNGSKRVSGESEDVMEKLKKLKEQKNNKASTKLRVIGEDDLKDHSTSDFSGSEDLEDAEYSEEEDHNTDPLEALRRLKEKKKKSSNNQSEIRIVKEDDLEDDDLSGDGYSEVEEDPMEALRLLKEKKYSGSTKSNGDVRIVKEDDLEDDSFGESDSYSSDYKSEFGGFDDVSDDESDNETKETKKNQDRHIIPDNAITQKDNEEIEYYAKKLGLKDGKKSKLSKTDDDDIIGGLLDGLDLDFSDDLSAPEDDVSSSDERESSEVGKLKVKQSTKYALPPSSKASQQDDDDLEYYAKKLGIKKTDNLPDADDDDLNHLLDGLDFINEEEVEVASEGSEEEIEDEDSDYSSSGEERVRENPYVAPSTDKGDKNDASISEQRYIPPALRRKMALEAQSEESKEILNLRKAIMGPMNKLSEANISSIVNEIQNLYMSHPRQVMNEQLTNIVLGGVIQQGRLLDTFVYLHACLVAAIYRLQGVEFGAHFIQTLIEKFEQFSKESNKKTEASNLITLLSSVYLFHLLSSKVLYDIVRELIINLNENNADLLLRLIRSSGNQMRTDDPSSLKNIIILLNEKYANLSADLKTSRIQFLIDTISTLKNNKMKVLNEGNHQLSIRLKKFLSGINNNKGGDPIQVSLDDIHNVDTRGKWWLVGSAWKGNEVIDKPGADVNEFEVNDVLDAAEPNWLELAKAQRMNTDIRRAVFISIMSATDFVDARTKLDKLSLKRAQEREIPKVLIHCTTIEPSWNPYYAVLANNLCDTHSFRKTFQFMLWDLIKELDDGDVDDEEVNVLGINDGDEETKLKKILNLGRFYGYLLAEDSLPLHSLKTANFLTSSPDATLFLEVLLFTFLDQIGKKSRKNQLGAGMIIDKSSKTDDLFDDRLLVQRIIKAKDQITLLRGLQYFLQEKVKASDLVTKEKQRVRVDWGVDAMFDVIDELLKDADEY